MDPVDFLEIIKNGIQAILRYQSTFSSKLSPQTFSFFDSCCIWIPSNNESAARMQIYIVVLCTFLTEEWQSYHIRKRIIWRTQLEIRKQLTLAAFVVFLLHVYLSMFCRWIQDYFQSDCRRDLSCQCYSLVLLYIISSFLFNILAKARL